MDHFERKRILSPGTNLARRYVRAVREEVKKIGVREVARRGGISPMSVSRLVNENEGVLFNSFCAIALGAGFAISLDHVAPGTREQLVQEQQQGGQGSAISGAEACTPLRRRTA